MEEEVFYLKFSQNKICIFSLNSNTLYYAWIKYIINNPLPVALFNEFFVCSEHTCQIKYKTCNYIFQKHTSKTDRNYFRMIDKANTKWKLSNGFQSIWSSTSNQFQTYSWVWLEGMLMVIWTINHFESIWV